MQELNLVELFTVPLEENKISYLVTGSMASVIYGEPRLTHDVDLVLNLKISDVEKFRRLFPLEKFYCPPQETLVLEIGREARAHFNLIHHETGFKADCYLVGSDPLHQWAFERKNIIKLQSGKSLSLAPPEYVILRKLEYYREGKAEKHLQDIRHRLRLSAEKTDLSFVESEAKKMGLADLCMLVLKRE